MQRRGGSEQAAKGQRASRPKARKAPIASVSAVDLEEQLDRRTRELDEALQQQTATSEVLSIIRRSPADAQPVFDAIVQSAARLCGAIFGAVYLCDDDRLRIAATKNNTPEAARQLHEVQQLKRPERSNLGGRAILDRAIVHVPDVLEDPEYSRELALAGGWRAVLAVPLLRDGNPVGALTVAKAEPRPFSDRQIQLLNTFADQALVAIENVRLFEAEQQRARELSEALEQQTATSEVLKVISSSPSELESVFETMLANATRICEAAFGSLLLVEGDMLRRVALHNAPPTFAEFHNRSPIIDPQKIPDLKRLVGTKQAVHIADAAAENPDGPISKYAGARTLLVVPMLKENDLIGAIGIYRQEVRPFTAKQIELVQNFAAQAVIAIENARLLNELRQRTGDLSEALEQQTATSEVLKVISSSPGELEPVFQVVLENATRICEAKFGVLYRCENGAFYAAAMLNAPQAFVEFYRQRGSFTPPAGTPLDRLLNTADTIYTVDDASEPNPGAPARFGGARSLVTVPMRKENKLVGAIIIYRQEVRPFTEGLSGGSFRSHAQG